MICRTDLTKAWGDSQIATFIGMLYIKDLTTTNNIKLIQGRIRMSKNHICYCFNYTELDIETDILENRKSTIEERIKAAKKAGSCECATKNPSGK